MWTQSPPTHRTRPPQANPVRGFTLIEVLIVITILAILIALLVPAVGSAQRRARILQVQTEINLLSSALTKFKTAYGTFPPSAIVLCEQASDWATYPQARATIRQYWPQYDFGSNNDIDADGAIDTTPHILTGGECLVFFLGGMPQQVTGGFTLSGFSKNPANPFSRGGNRDNPAFDFAGGRLGDLDTDGFPEFRDPWPGQNMPYLYYSAYDGAGYRTSGSSSQVEYQRSPPSATPNTGDATNGYVYPASPYLESLPNGATDSDSDMMVEILATMNQPAYNRTGFQIISPGADHEYGPGGPYQSGASVPLPGWEATAGAAAISQFPVADRALERDNLTNFTSGTLVP
jgi:prepilin-type N-terminal cleavage/methylation domain-containing protein